MRLTGIDNILVMWYFMRMRSLRRVDIKWSPYFAYAIGLLATDGNLSQDGRHFNLTSKDEELIKCFRTALCIKNKIGRKSRGDDPRDKKYYVVQFGDVVLYRFLEKVGLHPRKSRSIGKLAIPIKYFYDFFRGCIDGDGTIGTFRHPESRNPQLRVRLVSGSRTFLDWIHSITSRDQLYGYIKRSRNIWELAYPMGVSKRLLRRMYYPNFPPSLTRKYMRALPYLRA